MNDYKQLLGIAQLRHLHILRPEGYDPGVRLTSMQMQVSEPPENYELDLDKYEGQALIIQGHDGGGGWIYDAQIIDEAGPILSEVVKKLYGWTGEPGEIE